MKIQIPVLIQSKTIKRLKYLKMMDVYLHTNMTNQQNPEVRTNGFYQEINCIKVLVYMTECDY